MTENWRGGGWNDNGGWQADDGGKSWGSDWQGRSGQDWEQKDGSGTTTAKGAPANPPGLTSSKAGVAKPSGFNSKSAPPEMGAIGSKASAVAAADGGKGSGKAVPQKASGPPAKGFPSKAAPGKDSWSGGSGGYGSEAYDPEKAYDNDWSQGNGGGCTAKFPGAVPGKDSSLQALAPKSLPGGAGGQSKGPPMMKPPPAKGPPAMQPPPGKATAGVVIRPPGGNQEAQEEPIMSKAQGMSKASGMSKAKAKSNDAGSWTQANGDSDKSADWSSQAKGDSDKSADWSSQAKGDSDKSADWSSQAKGDSDKSADWSSQAKGDSDKSADWSSWAGWEEKAEAWGPDAGANGGWHSESGEPEAKRSRTSKWEETSGPPAKANMDHDGMLAFPSKAPPAKSEAMAMTKAKSAPPEQGGASVPVKFPEGKDAEWEIPWGKIFKNLKAGDLEARAGEYAEALMELRVQEDTCDAEIYVVESACNQLLMTAYREALLAHLKVLVDQVSADLQPEVIEAAHREADEPPSNNPVMSKSSGPAPGGAQPKGRAGAMPKAAMASAPQHGSLVVGGLPENVDDNQFRQLFQKFGTILSSKVSTEKRFGIVRFGTPMEAQAAIDKLNGFAHGPNMSLVVRFADRDTV